MPSARGNEHIGAQLLWFDERLGHWTFWLMNIGVVLWVAIHFFPIVWPQLDAVFGHGLACARSQAFPKPVRCLLVHYTARRSCTAAPWLRKRSSG